MRKKVRHKRYVDVGNRRVKCLPGTGPTLPFGESNRGISVICEFGRSRIIKYGRATVGDMQELFEKLQYLQNRKLKSVMRIHDFGELYRDMRIGEGYYYYVAERLRPLTKRDYEYLNGRNVACSTAAKRVEYLARRMDYADDHAGNFLRDSSGRIKIVDIEGFLGY